MKAIKNTVQPYRIYTFSLAESMPHLHVHLIPRGEAMPRAWKGRGIMSYPLTPGVSSAAMPQICAKLKAELKKLSLIG
jgi:diadenosine tetraphosphate (Ap4A) HIT family hydrolase